MDILVRAFVIRHDDRPIERIIEEVLSVPLLYDFYFNHGTKQIDIKYGAELKNVRLNPGRTAVFYPTGGHALFSEEEWVRLCVPASAESVDSVKTTVKERRGCFE